jgi:hypothetical protein
MACWLFLLFYRASKANSSRDKKMLKTGKTTPLASEQMTATINIGSFS